MNVQIDTLKNLIRANEASIAVLKNDEIFTAGESGIKPIINWINIDEKFFSNAVVADKIVGRAAALLFILSGAKSVYGTVMSEGAKKIFDEKGIACFYDELAPYIENRAKTGMCPMEETVFGESDPKKAFELLKKKIMA